MSLVTIVVPIYNMEKYMKKCIMGLLEQSFQDIEIVLVDDGSTDNSLELCDEYAFHYPDKIRVIHKENGGLSSARNAGIDIARGEYIIFPDPDDWVDSDYIEKAMQIQMKYQPDLVCMGHYVEYDDRTILANQNEKFIQMSGQEAQRSLLLPPCMNGFAWNKLYHLDIIRKNNLKFLDDVGTTEDLDFAFRYLKYCESVCFAPEARVYHYYQRVGAATQNKFSVKKLENIHTYEKMIQECSADSEIVEASENEICNTAINLCWMYKKDNCDDKESWALLRKYMKKYLLGYLRSRHYNVGRKVQAILAYFVPSLYVKLKNRVQNS